jgi:hypothetical protein
MPEHPSPGARNFSGTPLEGTNATYQGADFGLHIAVNSSGAFFNSRAGVGFADKYESKMNSLVGGTTAAQNFILLHEVAHYMQVPGFIANDGTDGPNRDRQKINNDKLWQNCEKTITGGLGPA